AQSLRRGRGCSVWLVDGDIEQGIHPAIPAQCEGAPAKIGPDPLLFVSGHPRRRPRRATEKQRSSGRRWHHPWGPPQPSMKDLLPRMAEAAQGGVPVVAISQPLDRYGIPSVVHDDAGGAEAALDYLCGRGMTPVAFLGRIRTSAVGSERYRGYRQGLAKA